MGVRCEGVEGASGKPPPRLRRGEISATIKIKNHMRALRRGKGKCQRLVKIRRPCYNGSQHRKGTKRMKKNDLLTLTADGLGADLEGVCRADGMAVFVPGMLPGETRRGYASSRCSPDSHSGVSGGKPGCAGVTRSENAGLRGIPPLRRLHRPAHDLRGHPAEPSSQPGGRTASRRIGHIDR